MKHLISIAILLISSIGFSQNDLNNLPNTNAKYDLHDLGMSVSVESAEELEAVLTFESITEFANMATGNEPITFELVCNYKSSKNNTKYHKSYKIVGTTGNIEKFIQLIEKTKASAIKGYKTFKSHD